MRNLKAIRIDIIIHCLLDSGMTFDEAHAVSAQIEGRLRDAIPRSSRVVVRTEPLPAIGEALS
jgi:divalent metal cation (Fe/Co/Zn/Cd) transporter